ncbi:MAG: hypothetical protein FWF10_00240 [Clostridiales bacterium]|nr:hypothetical protein [Clostridiales bacterium]
MHCLKRVEILLLLSAVILFAACGGAPAGDATPPAATATAVPVQISTPEDGLPARSLSRYYIRLVRMEEDPEDSFVDADSHLYVGAKEPRKLYGVQVNGSRVGTTLEVVFWRTGEIEARLESCDYSTVALRLTLADGRSMITMLDDGDFSYGVFIYCIDLDEDGTDEIFVSFDFWTSGNFEKLYILKITDSGFEEIGARVINTLESCAGTELIETADGPLLRIYTIRHRYDTRYVEYYYRDGKWILVRGETAARKHNPAEDVLKRWGLWELYRYAEPLAGEDALIEDEDDNYCDFGLDLYGTGKKLDRMYFSNALLSSDEKWITLIEYEREYGSGDKSLLGCFEDVLWWSWLRETCDLDGDGVDELVLSMPCGEKRQQETHVYQAQNGILREIFFHNSADPSAGYQIPYQIELPVFTDAVAWNAAVTRVWLEEFPEGISLMFAHGTEGYSRLSWNGSEWALLEQGRLVKE